MGKWQSTTGLLWSQQPMPPGKRCWFVQVLSKLHSRFPVVRRWQRTKGLLWSQQPLHTIANRTILLLTDCYEFYSQFSCVKRVILHGQCFVFCATSLSFVPLLCLLCQMGCSCMDT